MKAQSPELRKNLTQEVFKAKIKTTFFQIIRLEQKDLPYSRVVLYICI